MQSTQIWMSSVPKTMGVGILYHDIGCLDPHERTYGPCRIPEAPAFSSMRAIEALPCGVLFCPGAPKDPQLWDSP